MPEVLGAQVAIVALEVPPGALADGETATFGIEFEIDRGGNVIRSSMRTTSRPDLQDTILAQHRKWLYAVASRKAPCKYNRYVGVQEIRFSRTSGRLAMDLDLAQVERIVESIDAQPVPAPADRALRVVVRPETIVMPDYPAAGLRERVQADIGALFDFGPDGKVADAFTINVANDRWGFADAVLKTVRRYELKDPPGRTLHVCQAWRFVMP